MSQSSMTNPMMGSSEKYESLWGFQTWQTSVVSWFRDFTKNSFQDGSKPQKILTTFFFFLTGWNKRRRVQQVTEVYEFICTNFQTSNLFDCYFDCLWGFVKTRHTQRYFTEKRESFHWALLAPSSHPCFLYNYVIHTCECKWDNHELCGAGIFPHLFISWSIFFSPQNCRKITTIWWLWMFENHPILGVASSLEVNESSMNFEEQE